MRTICLGSYLTSQLLPYAFFPLNKLIFIYPEQLTAHVLNIPLRWGSLFKYHYESAIPYCKHKLLILTLQLIPIWSIWSKLLLPAVNTTILTHMAFSDRHFCTFFLCLAPGLHKCPQNHHPLILLPLLLHLSKKKQRKHLGRFISSVGV